MKSWNEGSGVVEAVVTEEAPVPVRTAAGRPPYKPSAVTCAVLFALSVAIVTGLCLWASQSRDIGLFLYGRVSYWIILAVMVVWGWQIARFLVERRFSPIAFARKNRVPLLAASVMTTIAIASVRPQFRVLSDETNLLAVSQSMVYHKTAYNSTQQKRYYEAMHPVSFELEKRPMVFPFLVHVVHAVRGYSPQNPFVLNGIALFVLVALIGIAAHRLAGAAGAVASVVLVGSYPLVVLTARSAGFDLLATVFGALSFGAAYMHMRQPSGRTLAVVGATLLVFAQIRYESSVFVSAIAAGLIVLGYVRWPFVREHIGLYAAAPCLLIPLIVQRILMPRPYENEAGNAPFSFAHFRKFVARFWDSQFNFDFIQPHAPILYWLAIPALLLTLFAVIRARNVANSPAKRHLLLIFIPAFLAGHIVLFSYYFGDITHPASARFFINLSVVVALLPLVLHVCAPSLLSGSRLLALALMLGLIYHPVSVQDRFTATQMLWRESEIQWQFLARRGDPNVLVVTSRPGQITAMNYGAVNFDYAKSNAASLLLELGRRLYSDILVFQRISYDTGNPVPADWLGTAFRLQPISELQSSAAEFVRISRVIP